MTLRKATIVLAAQYERLDSALSRIIETEERTAETIGCADTQARALLLPSIDQARRRLLALAAAMSRTQAAIAGDAQNTSN